jgi:hypothetical protein
VPIEIWVLQLGGLAGLAPSSIIEWVALGIGLALLGLLTYWIVDEREDARDRADLIESVGDRAQGLSGGVVSATGSLVVVLIGIGITVGRELLMSLGDVAMMLEPAAGFVSALVVGGVGFLTVNGSLGLSTAEFGAIATSAIVIGLFWRYA